MSPRTGSKSNKIQQVDSRERLRIFFPPSPKFSKQKPRKTVELAGKMDPSTLLQGDCPRLPLGKTHLRMTDISQGCEMTPEGQSKNEAPVRAYSMQESPNTKG